MRKILAIPILVVFLSSCSSIFGVDRTPDQTVQAAKAIYTIALKGINAAIKAGDISDETLVLKIEPVRAKVDAAITLAEEMLALAHPDAEEQANEAFALAEAFDELWKSFKGGT